MKEDDVATVRLVRFDAHCVPGGEAEISSPDLTPFREGDYPGQWRGGIRKRRRVDEVVVSPDRIGRVVSSTEATGRLVFRASGWDYEQNSEELRERVVAALREEMERFCGRVQASIDALPAPGAEPKPK